MKDKNIDLKKKNCDPKIHLIKQAKCKKRKKKRN